MSCERRSSSSPTAGEPLRQASHAAPKPGASEAGRFERSRGPPPMRRRLSSSSVQIKAGDCASSPRSVAIAAHSTALCLTVTAARGRRWRLERRPHSSSAAPEDLDGSRGPVYLRRRPAFPSPASAAFHSSPLTPRPSTAHVRLPASAEGRPRIR